MWSFNDWIGRRGFFFQLYFDEFFRLSPYISAYILFLYYYAVFAPSTTYGMTQAIMIPLIVASVGSILVESVRNSKMTEVKADEATNLDLWWNPSVCWTESNIILEIIPLIEKELKADVTGLSEEAQEALAELEKDPAKKLLYGEYAYLLKFLRTMRSPDDDEFSWIILISPFPQHRIFVNIPGQMMLHKGVVFTTPTSRLALIYLHHFSEVAVQYKVFTLALSPQHVVSAQMGVGIIHDPDKNEVERAAQISIDHRATAEAVRRKDAEDELIAWIDNREDPTAIAHRMLARWWGNREKVYQRSKEESRLENKEWAIGYIAAAAISIYLFARWIGWVG